VFAKLCVLTISIGAIGCTLLALRQQRIEAVHQMAMGNLRIMEADRGLARLRTDIVARLEPKKIEALATKIGPLHPIEMRPTRPGTVPDRMQPAYAQNNNRRQQASVPQSSDDAAYGGGVSRP